MQGLTEAHFAVLRRHMVEVIAIHAELAADELGRPALDARVHGRDGAGAAPPLRAGPARPGGLPGHAAADRLRQDDLAAVHRRGDDRPARPAARRRRCSRSAPASATRRRSWRGWRAGCGASRSSRSWRSRPRRACGGSDVANVAIRVGDGSRGWAGHAPFDKVLVAAAAERGAAGAGRAAPARRPDGAAAGRRGRAGARGAGQGHGGTGHAAGAPAGALQPARDHGVTPTGRCRTVGPSPGTRAGVEGPKPAPACRAGSGAIPG